MRSVLLTLSRRRSLGRVATRAPLARSMVARFVAGERLEDALDALERLRDRGFGTTVDILGESVGSIDAARAAADGYLETLDALAERGLDRNVSLKLSQMGLLVDEASCRDNVRRIVDRAGELGGFVRIDMEDHTMVDRTLGVWRHVRPAPPATEAGDHPSGCGVVIQAALRRSPADVEALLAERASVRLCKGAYKEPWSVAHQDRADIDGAFAGLMGELLRRGVYPALATHDPRLIREAIDTARVNAIEPNRFEFQMLYGIRRDLQENLRAAGYGVRVYVPFGREWWPYFMRRLAERPANVAFLLRSVLGERRRPGGVTSA
jgi:proline dehydrogenase